MKKLISLMLAIVLVLSFAGCGAQPEEATEQTEEQLHATEETEALTGGYQYDTEFVKTKPDYSHINEFEPNKKGVYQIHTKEGLLNMANHPDADFEILWDIDLEGAKWTPLGTKDEPFEGEIEGGFYTISNFVIDTPNEDGDMGFFGTFEGSVKELNLANVTITTTADTKRAGLWCAYNDGSFLRCENAGSKMIVEEMAKDAIIGGIVGTNDGNFRNGTMFVEMTVSAKESGDISPIIGYAKSGKAQFIKNEGGFTVTNGANKNIGLFAGRVEAKAEIKGAVFLGATNTVDGQLFTTYTGAGERDKVTECLYRDNVKEEIPEHIMEMRMKAVQTMYEHGSYVWYLDRDLYYSCWCDLAGCYGMIPAGTEIHGNLYNHKGGSLARLKSMMDENDHLQDWVYDVESFDGWDVYIGCDCSTAVQSGLFAVYAEYDSNLISSVIPTKNPFDQIVGVGDWEWDITPTPSYTITHCEATGEERMYEAYALLRPGDTVNNRLNNGLQIGSHIRMVAQDAVVVRDEEGKIDGGESYVTTHEQGGGRTLEPYFSSWSLNKRYSFNSLWQGTYVPCTIKPFVTGEFEEKETYIEGGNDGYLGLTTGIVRSNYFLDGVTVVITDSQGNEVFNHTMFTTASRFFDDQRRDNDWELKPNMHEFDMCHYATPLSEMMFTLGETYSYTITAILPAEERVPVKDGSFTYGQA